MNELVGPLGVPGAVAAIVLALERGFAFALSIRAARNGKNGPGTAHDIAQIRESVARIEAGFEARLGVQEREIALLREQGERMGSRIAARCEEIIEPCREQIAHLETRVDGIAHRRRR